MHVYSDDINNPNSLNQTDQTDKKETDFGRLAQSVKTLQSVKTTVKTLQSVKTKVKTLQSISVRHDQTKLIQELKRLKLDTSGSKKVLVKRLNMCQSLTIQNAHGDYPKENFFDFYVVIDFEATCDQQKTIKPEHQEIIEFPAVLLNCKNGKVEDEFQSYCRPILHPLLTDYCTKLTGITQDIVDKAPSFPETFASFNEWLQKNNLGSKFSFAIVTDGTKDMGHFLKRQCVLSNILFPEYGKYWVNIRKTFSNFYKVGDMQHRARLINKTVLAAMMNEMGYKFKGRAHSGLDDARNIARIVQGLLKDGASIIFNERLPKESEEEQNGKQTFSLPVLEPEFGILKDTLKSNFPTKNCPTNILEKSTVNEAAIKSCTNSAVLHGEIVGETTLETAAKKAPALKSGKTVPKPAQKMSLAKNEVGKTGINGALSNISVEDASLIDIATKIVTEDVVAKKNKNSPTFKLQSNVSEGEIAAVIAKKSVKATNKGTPTKILVNEDPTATTAVKIPEKLTPMKTTLGEAPIKIPANEIAIKTSEKKPLVQNAAKSAPAKNCTKKIPATDAMNSSPTSSAQCSVQSTKTQEKESPLITTPENRGKKTKRRRVKKLPTEAVVKGSDAKKIPDVSESSIQTTAEVLAKELKLAQKKFYGKTQYAEIPIGELRKERKKIENLKKSLKAARLREAPCVPCKAPVEEGITIAKGSNVTKKRNTIQASEKAPGHSQKKKASPSKEGNNSENKKNKKSQETMMRDTKNPLPDKITASLPLDENPRPKEESICDKAKEELFFHMFENVLNTQTMRHLEGNE